MSLWNNVEPTKCPDCGVQAFLTLVIEANKHSRCGACGIEITQESIGGAQCSCGAHATFFNHDDVAEFHHDHAYCD